MIRTHNQEAPFPWAGRISALVALGGNRKARYPSAWLASDDTSRKYFADGLSQTIFNALVRVRGLTGVSWNAFFRYKTTPRKPTRKRPPPRSFTFADCACAAGAHRCRQHKNEDRLHPMRSKRCIGGYRPIRCIKASLASQIGLAEAKTAWRPSKLVQAAKRGNDERLVP
jgi:hypothetical protein